MHAGVGQADCPHHPRQECAPPGAREGALMQGPADGPVAVRGHGREGQQLGPHGPREEEELGHAAP